MGSLWGRVSTCNACDFFFQSNHSYDTRGFVPEMRGFFEAVCIECLQAYIFPTESAWGPGYAELLELCTCVQEEQTKQQTKKKYQESGIGRVQGSMFCLSQHCAMAATCQI
ncbi:hypothetical protein ACO0LG_28950 [Undibacterium sp. Ji42W]|uniref:hypothetical protein n=1 Tax=Undibacterium sp. Ji42W TaxID=3413039 RepID=UPI003BF2ADB5